MKIGSVTELGPGRWRVRGPRPERLPLGVYPTQERAEAVLAAAVDELARADRARSPGVTVRDFGARVLSERARELPRSAQAERCRWKRIEVAPFADEPISALTLPIVDRWARSLAARLPGSAKPTLSLLSAVCREAVREELLAANPCHGVRLRLPARTHEPWTYLTPDEQRALLTAPIPEVDALQIGCLLGSGIRDGELFALRLADVHAHAAEPHLVIRYGSKHGPTKGKKIRKVPLFGLGLASFRRWLAVLPAYCPENPRGLCFPGPRGGFQKPGEFLVRHTTLERKKVLLDDFREALRLAGIVPERRHDGRPVRAHDLRHTFAASLVSGWWGEPWRLEDLRPVMGHHSVKVTEMYAHLAPGRVEELARRSPGPQPGHGPAATIVLASANRAPIALMPAAPGGAGCSTPPSKNPGVRADFGPGVPPVPREVAIEGLRAIDRGDLDAARALVDAAGLLWLFDAALDADAEEQPSGKRGRR